MLVNNSKISYPLDSVLNPLLNGPEARTCYPLAISSMYSIAWESLLTPFISSDLPFPSPGSSKHTSVIQPRYEPL